MADGEAAAALGPVEDLLPQRRGQHRAHRMAGTGRGHGDGAPRPPVEGLGGGAGPARVDTTRRSPARRSTSTWCATVLLGLPSACASSVTVGRPLQDQIQDGQPGPVPEGLELDRLVGDHLVRQLVVRDTMVLGVADAPRDDIYRMFDDMDPKSSHSVHHIRSGVVRRAPAQLHGRAPSRRRSPGPALPAPRRLRHPRRPLRHRPHRPVHGQAARPASSTAGPSAAPTTATTTGTTTVRRRSRPARSSGSTRSEPDSAGAASTRTMTPPLDARTG